MEAFMAMIAMFGMNWIPRNWAGCWGQPLNIANNTALYALLGLIYGGDGRVSFNLPDLRGRVPMGTGQGPGLPQCDSGDRYGYWSRTLLVQNLPAHNHLVEIPAPAVSVEFKASDQPGTETVPGTGSANTMGAPDSRYGTKLYNSDDPSVALDGVEVTNASGPQTVSSSATGSGTAFDVVQPSLGLSFGICTDGIFPQRQ